MLRILSRKKNKMRLRIPTNRFTISELKNTLHDVPELQKT